MPDTAELSHTFELFQAFTVREKPLLLVYGAAMCVLALERVAVPHIYGKLLAAIRKMTQINQLFVILVVAFCVFQALETWITVMDAHLAPAFEAFVRENVVDNVIDRHRMQYEELNLGNLTSKLIKLPTYMREVFYRAKSFVLFNMLSVLTTAVYLFYCHWWLGSIFSAVCVLLFLGARHFVGRCQRASYQREAAFDNTQEEIQDVFSNLLAVYNSSNEPSEQRRVKRLNTELMQKVHTSVYCGIPYRILFSVCFVVMFAGITGAGIHLFRTKRLAMDRLVSSFIVTFAMLKTCMHIYYDIQTFIYLRGGLQVVEDFLRNLPKKNAGPPPRFAKLQAAGTVVIRFRDVHFAYASRPALRGVSLDIPSGQRVAITGGIGSGKSSLMHLLVRLQCCASGSIEVNGLDVRALNVSELRQTIHYVSQQPRLFNRTLWQNLSYGNPALRSPDRIYALLRSHQLHEVESTFRHLMHLPIGKQGSKLSGGQRQLAWIIRGILTPSRVLVLDEPTSAMDARTRRQVMKLIDGLVGGRTVILVTHDPDILQLAERVVRLERGQLVHDSSLGGGF